MERTGKKLKEQLRLLYEAMEYPLALRIAVNLHLQGVKYEDFCRSAPHIPEEMRSGILNELRDLQFVDCGKRNLDRGKVIDGIKLRTLRKLALHLSSRMGS